MTGMGAVFDVQQKSTNCALYPYLVIRRLCDIDLLFNPSYVLVRTYVLIYGTTVKPG